MCNYSRSVSPLISSGDRRYSIAVLHLLLSLFHLFAVLYLSLLLKKRAWDSPAKRFGNFFNLYFAFTFLYLAIANFFCLNRAIIIVRYPVSVAYFNLAALLVALSLQLVAPFLSERVKKQCACRPHCVEYIEVIIHVIFLLLMILSAPFSLMLCKLIKHEFMCHDYNIIATVELIIVGFSNIILFLSFGVLVFTFCKYPNINKRIKHVILKLVFVIIIAIIYTILIIFTHKNITFFLLHILFKCLLALSIVPLNFPLHIWCYACCLIRRKSQESRASLLPINDTESQHTNPLSVWDHRNVPSYTETNLPFEMSDGRSINSFSVLTPSVHYR